jgi:hypothetical protein
MTRASRPYIALVIAVVLGGGMAAAYIQFGPRALIALVVLPGYLLVARVMFPLSVGGIEFTFDDAIKGISEAPPDQIQQVAAAEIRLLSDYYRTALAQARTSFNWALIGVGVGLVFFGGAVAVQLTAKQTDAATISAVAGGVVEVISGLNFVLYGKATGQLSEFHERLERTQRFMLANSMCASLVDDVARDHARAALIQTIAAYEPA